MVERRSLMNADGRPTVRPARSEDVYGYVEVLVRAFPDKFKAIFGDDANAAAGSIVDHYTPLDRYPGHYVAAHGAEIHGALHLATTEGGGPGWKGMLPFVRRLGILRGLRAVIALSILGSSVKPDEAYVAHLAVDPGLHRQGLGTMLLEYAEQRARILGKARLTLYVAGGNDAARGLYLARGFRLVKTDKSEITRRLVGIGLWEYMIKDL
jgi:ribosomal protein S18 acetylase RimI-like enzyme